MRNFRIYILIGLLLTLSLPVLAQDEADTVKSLPGIEIKTSVDKAEMYVGDLITYTISITYDSTYELVPPPLGANLGAFDVKDYLPDQEKKLDDGRISSITTFKLSTFTTGDYVIPPVPVQFNLPDSTHKILLSEAVPIKVQSLLETEGDSLDIHPLKAQFEFKRDYTMYYIYGAAGLVLLIILIVLFWYWRKRRRGREEPVDLRDPWEIAFEKLALLKTKDLLAEGQFKQFYFELTELYREYLGRIYVLDVKEMTTEEFVEKFERIELPENVYNNSITFFKHADLVKFARMDPADGRPESDLDVIYQMIDTIRAQEERRRQLIAGKAEKANEENAMTTGAGV